MSWAFAALCTVTLACASTSTTTSSPASQSIGVSGMAGRLTINPGSGPSTSSLPATVDQVWRVLPAAFDSLGIPVTQVDPVKRVMGNPGFKLRQRLGRVSLSRYVDCGQTQVGPNADSYDVHMTILVSLQAAAAGGTTASTNFEVLAKPIAFSQDYSRCSTRGYLESRLMEAVKAQLPR